ncbi:MAG: hypothetical protein K0U93_27345 [Gammaproteobacteria bacterium]|nr:hypothetical protein [Gammaproteobacteria bacterium]
MRLVAASQDVVYALACDRYRAHRAVRLSDVYPLAKVSVPIEARLLARMRVGFVRSSSLAVLLALDVTRRLVP